MNDLVFCERVTKRHGAHTALCDFTWTLPKGESVGLIGPSGAGKTTLLRIIAGLERCSSGEVRFAASEQNRKRRGMWLGMVFQNQGLWPHLTAWQHIECMVPRWSGNQRKRRVEELLSEVMLAPELWSRRPAELSGGEAQRLALARALAPGPSLLLLDEPLAQVDMPLRADLIALIRRLRTEKQLTVLYATHSWQEIQDLCTQLAVVVAGRLKQQGPADQVFARPVSAAVARLTGPVVEIPTALIEDKRIRVSSAMHMVQDGAMTLLRPQQTRFTSPEGQNCWKVVGIRPYGPGWQLTLQSGSTQLSVASTQWLSLDATVAIVLNPLPFDGDSNSGAGHPEFVPPPDYLPG
jgi:ABC-type sulfate/molybdate transport systems ATPase subunit